MFYLPSYNNLCSRGKDRKDLYGPGSGLHKHHIVPVHRGGSDAKENFTYLTVREHQIAHFLLWKINGSANDLRSMYMLGCNLTTTQRQKIGKWCVDNNIGIHGWTLEQRREKGLRVFEDQKNNPDNEFHYWASPEGRKERASRGGKASMVSGNNKAFQYWSSPEGRFERRSRGGKAGKGKKAMHIPGEKTFIRVPESEWERFLADGYVFGSPLTPRKGTKITGPSPNNKKVTDGNMVFESLKAAAEYYGVTSSAICCRIKSKKSPLRYVV